MTISRQLSWGWILVLMAVACPQPAHAGGGVSICSGAGAEAALRTALTGGGTVTFSCAGTIALTNPIAISLNTFIAGPGGVVISGGGKVQIFAVAPTIHLTLSHLTLVNGLYTNGAYGGGAIFNNGGNVSVASCTFYNNASTGSLGGGAILNAGTLAVSDSSFGQSTGNGNTAGIGGAIANAATGYLTVNNSTFANNAAAGNPALGGAIYNLGTLVVVNSTFWENGGSNASGGNIYSNNANPNFVFVTSSTITDGLASGSSQGGNVYYIGGGGFTLADSIVAYDSATPPPDCFGTITDGGGNLTWPADCAGVGTLGNPTLGPLANYGGPTDTMALLAGSAAIFNAHSSCPTGDQRGVLRPTPTCDTGAFEYSPELVIKQITNLQEQINLPPTCNCQPIGGLFQQRIAEPLADSLDPRLWLPDGDHLNLKTGTRVFDLHEQVVNNLSDLIVDQTELIYITTLVNADRELAVFAMNAKGCGANPNPAPNVNVSGACAQAAADLAAGDARAGMGAYGRAIDYYQNAWQLTTQ